MLRSLYAGVSAIKVNQAKLDVIANNIANVGTTAFKSSRVRFKDMISQSVTESAAPGRNQGGVNLKQVGQGVQISGIDTMVGQGMMQPTSRTLDVAMDGEGYLMVGKGLTPTGNATTAAAGTAQKGVTLGADYSVSDSNGLELFYTRDGALTLDTNGNLLNSDGLRVLGYAVNDGTNTSLQYDASGNPVMKYANANSANITTGKQLIPLVIPDKIHLPATAQVGTPASTDYAPAIAQVGTAASTDYAVGPPVVGTPASADYAPAVAQVGTPASADYAAAALAKDVRITSYSIERDGSIKAVLEDGKVSVLGQIATSAFKNPAGLAKVGGNLYSTSSNSGEAVIRTGATTSATAYDNSKSYGDMLSGMLEMSNVDLAETFTDMIITTRAFQAAGKTITTGDEILQEIINLKR